MINTIVTYDDIDGPLGNYFNKSYLHIDELKSQPNLSITGLSGCNCLENNISKIIPPVNQQNFVFVGLSHGAEDGFSLMGADNYVNVNNANLFLNSFFYSTACHIGKELSKILLSHGCKCFIGYTDVSEAPLNEEHEDLFIECELHALRNFYLTTSSIQVLYNEMIAFTDEKFIELANGNDILDAMALVRNRNCMIIVGDDANKQLTRLDFDV
ncbi:hypothetical protein ACHRV5_08620 [Flavobacterium sp. FlaQc-52]|jgi:hypothetical protein|uniref:hypothetical protein n=1 Tax=Flavobacterium sp. FlaQc-52 TaxID=3374185 RepID=UPI003757B442